MMTYTYRKAKSEEREQCIELANYVFSTAHRPHDFETLIPKVYGEGRDCAPLHLAAVREDGRFRAEVAVLPEQLHVCGQTLNAGVHRNRLRPSQRTGRRAYEASDA